MGAVWGSACQVDHRMRSSTGVEAVWGSASRHSAAHLGEAVEHADDGLGLEPDADRGVQGVRCQLILVDELRPAHWLRNGNEEVVRL